MIITSLNNEKVLNWVKLKNKKDRDKENIFLVEGDNLVEEALKKNIVKEIITTYQGQNYSVPCYEVNEKIMRKITSMVNPPKIMAVCHFLMPEVIEGKVLLLDKLQDPGNLGTIIRSAVAFNFKTLILSEECVDIYNDKVIRASEGMFFHLNILKDNLLKVIDTLHEKGYEVIGTDVIKGKNPPEFTKEKTAFVIGSEGNGISEEVKNKCDDFLNIPMNKTCESLNAAVAASIIMYEASR